jgi:hypothetical protein
MSQISTTNVKCCSTASGYLLNAVKRNNFDILIHTHTSSVQFDQQKQVTDDFYRTYIY